MKVIKTSTSNRIYPIVDNDCKPSSETIIVAVTDLTWFDALINVSLRLINNGKIEWLWVKKKKEKKKKKNGRVNELSCTLAHKLTFHE